MGYINYIMYYRGLKSISPKFKYIKLNTYTVLNPDFQIPGILVQAICHYEIAGTTNPGGTRKPDNPLKGISDPIPRNPDNILKEIQDLVQNETRSQWPIGLTVST